MTSIDGTGLSLTMATLTRPPRALPSSRVILAPGGARPGIATDHFVASTDCAGEPAADPIHAMRRLLNRMQSLNSNISGLLDRLYPDPPSKIPSKVQLKQEYLRLAQEYREIKTAKDKAEESMESMTNSSRRTYLRSNLKLNLSSALIALRLAFKDLVQELGKLGVNVSHPEWTNPLTVQPKRFGITFDSPDTSSVEETMRALLTNPLGQKLVKTARSGAAKHPIYGGKVFPDQITLNFATTDDGSNGARRVIWSGDQAVNFSIYDLYAFDFPTAIGLLLSASLPGLIEQASERKLSPAETTKIIELSVPYLQAFGWVLRYIYDQILDPEEEPHRQGEKLAEALRLLSETAAQVFNQTLGKIKETRKEKGAATDATREQKKIIAGVLEAALRLLTQDNGLNPFQFKVVNGEVEARSATKD